MNNTQSRDALARALGALRLRIATIDGEMVECAELVDACIEACLDHLNWLADQRSVLTRSLWVGEKRLAQAAFWESPEVVA